VEATDDAVALITIQAATVLLELAQAAEKIEDACMSHWPNRTKTTMTNKWQVPCDL